jgi:hypothetical protein
MKNLFLILFLFSAESAIYANSLSAPDMPLSHCYHWLKEGSYGYLTTKYKHAEKTNGELLNVTGSGGTMAGVGLYCAKTLAGSADYGDRVIRLDFVDDVVIYKRGDKKYCGARGAMFKNQSDCDSKQADAEMYDASRGWIVIKNLASIKSWSANSKQLIEDLNAIMKEDSRNTSHYKTTIGLIEAEVKKMGNKTFTNPKARMDVMEMLAQENKWEGYDLGFLLNQTVTNPKVGAKKSYYQTKLTSFMFNHGLEGLQYDTFKTVMAADSSYKNIYLSEFKKLNLAKTTNKKWVLATLEDNPSFTVPSNVAKSLIQGAIENEKADALAFAKSENKSIQAEFNSLIKQRDFLSSILNQKNLEAVAEAVNGLPAKTPKLKSLGEVIMKAAMETKSPAVVGAVAKKLSEPVFESDKAVFDFYVSQVGTLKTEDLINVYESFGSISQNQKEIFKSEIEKRLMNDQDAIETSMRNYLALYPMNIKVISAARFMDFLGKKIQQSLGNKSDFRIYSVISSVLPDFGWALKAKATQDYDGFYTAAQDFYFKSISQSQNDKDSKLTDALMTGLSTLIVKPTSSTHALIGAYSLYPTGDAQKDQALENFFTTRLDPSILMTIAYDIKTDRAKALLKKTFEYLGSPELQALLKTPEFQKNQEALLSKRAYIQRSKYRLDVCAIEASIKNFEKDLQPLFSNELAAAQSNLNEIKALPFCKDKTSEFYDGQDKTLAAQSQSQDTGRRIRKTIRQGHFLGSPCGMRLNPGAVVELTGEPYGNRVNVIVISNPNYTDDSNVNAPAGCKGPAFTWDFM